MDTLKKNGNKYLGFATTDKNKEVLERFEQKLQHFLNDAFQ